MKLTPTNSLLAWIMTLYPMVWFIDPCRFRGSLESKNEPACPSADYEPKALLISSKGFHQMRLFHERVGPQDPMQRGHADVQLLAIIMHHSYSDSTPSSRGI